MTQTINSLRNIIADAQTLQDALHGNAQQFEYAIEQRMTALRNQLNAKRAYEDAEAEFAADFAFSAAPESEYGKAKNAETRKLALDRALIQARTKGPLAQAWRVLNDTTAIFDEADMAYNQMELRWKATKAAAELQTAILRAAAE